MTTSPIINNNSITIFVGPGTDISELTPEFTLTPGATINPLSGTERNFNTPQEYTVTAADGVWKKTYIISVIDTELATNYNFEDTLGGKKYYIFVEREGETAVAPVGRQPFVAAVGSHVRGQVFRVGKGVQAEVVVAYLHLRSEEHTSELQSRE